MFITVRDKSKTRIINMNEIQYVYNSLESVYVFLLDSSSIPLTYNSAEEAEEAIKEISLLIGEKQQK